MKKIFIFCLMFLLFINYSFAKMEKVQISGVELIKTKTSWVSKCMDIVSPPWAVFVATQEVVSVEIRRYLDVNCTLPAGVVGDKKVIDLKLDPRCPANSYCGDLGGEMPTFAIKLVVNNLSTELNRVLFSFLIHDPPEKVKSKLIENDIIQDENFK